MQQHIRSYVQDYQNFLVTEFERLHARETEIRSVILIVDEANKNYVRRAAERTHWWREVSLIVGSILTGALVQDAVSRGFTLEFSAPIAVAFVAGVVLIAVGLRY